MFVPNGYLTVIITTLFTVLGWETGYGLGGVACISKIIGPNASSRGLLLKSDQVADERRQPRCRGMPEVLSVGFRLQSDSCFSLPPFLTTEHA